MMNKIMKYAVIFIVAFSISKYATADAYNDALLGHIVQSKIKGAPKLEHGKISKIIAQFNDAFIKNDFEFFSIGPCYAKIKNKKREPE